MSNSQKDERISGIVKIKDFKKPSPAEIPQFSSLKESSEFFHEHTPYIYRGEGLSGPINVEGGFFDRLTDQCVRITNYIRALINVHRALVGRHFTVIDGTMYDKIPETERLGRDVIFTNVHWRGSIMYLVFMIGERRWHKEPTLWFEENRTARHCVAMRIDSIRRDPELRFMVHRALLNHQSNEMQMSYYGLMVQGAIDRLMQPRAECEFPIAAAVYCKGRVAWADRPYRHHHVVQSAEFHDLKALTKDTAIQGFLTNHGNFVTRRRALYQVHQRGVVLMAGELGVTLERMADSSKDPREGDMGGILDLEDYHPRGYVVTQCGLFSEDLW